MELRKRKKLAEKRKGRERRRRETVRKGGKSRRNQGFFD